MRHLKNIFCFSAGSLWGLANSDLAWSAVSPYQSHSLWHDSPPLHPGQYQPDLFGFTGEIWGGGRGAGHGRQLLQYQKQAKKRRRVATAAQRRAANIRERRRMFNLNESFDRLRSKVNLSFKITPTRSICLFIFYIEPLIKHK